MTNVQVTVGIALILLVFIAGGLAVIVVSNQKNVNDAKVLGQSALDYFKKVDKKCSARSNEFTKISTCLQDLKQQLGVIGDLKEQSFMDYSARRNETGFLVLENKGRTPLNSSGFNLYKNHEMVDQGCIIEGSIDPGYLCRLEFDTPCEKGDVLEVMYTEKRAFLKTC
ncbi:MAG: hypothetical protein AABX70_08735 [Nanoarchaeota archaeon]